MKRYKIYKKVVFPSCFFRVACTCEATPNQNVPESERSRIRTVPNQNRVLNQNCSYQNCHKSELSGIRTVPKQNCSFQNCPESELSCIRTVPNQNCPEAELFVS
uniref:Uncharacterized protein n=1 Tax=Caenorhabditis japonica TaxID=281687 RepID=A0A8R1EQB4_CAEJA